MVSSLETVASISLVEGWTDDSAYMVDHETDCGEAAHVAGFPNPGKQADYD